MALLFDLKMVVKMDKYWKLLIGQRIVKTEDGYWIISCTTNAIWRCNEKFDVVDYLIFEDEEISEHLFRAIVCVNNIIYCFPFNAKNAYMINTQSNDIEKMSLDVSWNELQYEKFNSAVVVDDFIIVVGRSVWGFLKYNISTQKSSFITEGWSINDTYMSALTVGVLGNSVYTISTTDATLLKYNFVDDKIVQYNLADYCDNSLSSIMSADNYIYIANDRYEILKFDKNLKYVSSERLERQYDRIIRLFGKDNGSFWFVGNSYGKMLIWTEKGSRLYDLEVECDLDYGYCFTAVEVFGENIFLQSRQTGKIVVFNIKERRIEKKNIFVGKLLGERYAHSLLAVCMHRNAILKEDMVMTIRCFMEDI